MHIKGNHILNMRKTLLYLGYRIKQQALLMHLMKMLILIPLKCLNLIKKVAMGPNLKCEYQILPMQVAKAWKVLIGKERVFLPLLLMD